MMVKDFKKTRAARTAARKAGHRARVETKWAKHVPAILKAVDDYVISNVTSTACKLVVAGRTRS